MLAEIKVLGSDLKAIFIQHHIKVASARNSFIAYCTTVCFWVFQTLVLAPPPLIFAESQPPSYPVLAIFACAGRLYQLLQPSAPYSNELTVSQRPMMSPTFIIILQTSSFSLRNNSI